MEGPSRQPVVRLREAWRFRWKAAVVGFGRALEPAATAPSHTARRAVLLASRSWEIAPEAPDCSLRWTRLARYDVYP